MGGQIWNVMRPCTPCRRLLHVGFLSSLYLADVMRVLLCFLFWRDWRMWAAGQLEGPLMRLSSSLLPPFQNTCHFRNLKTN